jgi:hypothetical protein
MGLGFRQGWIEGNSDTVTFELDSGAGLGSPHLILSVTFKRDGKDVKVIEWINMQELVPAWIAKIEESLDAAGPGLPRCPRCKHIRHGNEVCLNMQSDNDCNCTGVADVDTIDG